jgi:predicted AlkP superfamily pyrophosphatase or phosphodiesterase
MRTLSDSIIAALRVADRLPYAPAARPELHRQPTHALLIVVDGITPAALAAAETPTLDALAAHGVSAARATTIFPSITGPAHTSLVTGAPPAVHGFPYPFLLNAAGDGLEPFHDGLHMRAETIAEAWRAQGLTSAAVGERFLRGACYLSSEFITGHDVTRLTGEALRLIQEDRPHFLMVTYYAADSMGHVFGPESEETLAAIELIDRACSDLLAAYSAVGLRDRTVVVALADHGHVAIEQQVLPEELAPELPLFAHGRIALCPIPPDPTAESWRRLAAQPAVEYVFDEQDLARLHADAPGLGRAVVLLREGYGFGPTNLRGHHGAWSATEQRIPLILSGCGIRAGASLDTCAIIDIAPTLSWMLGAAPPRHSRGRVLEEILDHR